MDRTRYRIRPFVDADFESEARIDREFYPEHAPTTVELRHWDHLLSLQRDHLNLRLAVEDARSGEVVAYASLAQPSFNYDPRWYWLWVAVAPGHRRSGIGGELYTRLEAEARARGGEGLWGNSRESDPAGMSFFARHGFRPLSQIWLSRIDLNEQDLSTVPDRSAELASQGIRFSTLSEEGAQSPDVREKLFRLSGSSAADVPRLGRFQPLTFEEFLADQIDNPGSIPEGLFLAFKDSEVVGMSSLEKDLARPDTVRVGYTGVLRGFRGHGIATELKRRAALFARARGFRHLTTGNDSRNQSILRINQLFGFRKETVWVQGEKSLVP